MSVHFVQAYWPGVLGLAVGFVAGELVGRAFRSHLPAWDARVTVPLLLAAAAAHLFLIPAVEAEREVLFGLYGAALLGATAFALLGLSIWRVGAVLFPVGSIGAYVFFALQVHQADYIGLAVKLVELGAITAAVASLAMRRKQDRARPVAA